MGLFQSFMHFVWGIVSQFAHCVGLFQSLCILCGIVSKFVHFVCGIVSQFAHCMWDCFKVLALCVGLFQSLCILCGIVSKFVHFVCDCFKVYAFCVWDCFTVCALCGNVSKFAQTCKNLTWSGEFGGHSDTQVTFTRGQGQGNWSERESLGGTVMGKG